MQSFHRAFFRRAVVAFSRYLRVHRYGVLSFSFYRRGKFFAAVSLRRRPRFKMRPGNENGRKNGVENLPRDQLVRGGGDFSGGSGACGAGQSAFSLFVSAAFLCFGAFSGGGRYEKIRPIIRRLFRAGQRSNGRRRTEA